MIPDVNLTLLAEYFSLFIQICLKNIQKIYTKNKHLTFSIMTKFLNIFFLFTLENKTWYFVKFSMFYQRWF